MLILSWVKKIRRDIEFWWFYKNFYQKFTFYTSDQPEELDELFRLRYQVYIEEYHYIDKTHSENGRERDVWDPHSVHFIIRDLQNRLVASVRLILDSEDKFPIEEHFELDINLDKFPRTELAEISRLIVAKEYRRHHLMLVLIKGIYLYVKKHNIQNIFSVMDDKLLPALIKLGIPFQRIGKASLYQGYTFPCLLNVQDLENDLKECNIRLYRYLADGVLKYNELNHKYSVV